MGILKKLFNSISRERQKREKFEELEEDGEEEFVNSQKATWLVNRGIYYRTNGMLDEALRDFEEALQLKSDHLGAHYSKALVYVVKGEIDKVQKLLREMPDEMRVDGNVVARKGDILNDLYNNLSAAVQSGEVPSAWLDVIPSGLKRAKIAHDKKESTVILVSAGERRIEVLKEVRAITGLDLKGAKDLVDNAPKPVKEGISENEAKMIQMRLRAAGATVEVR